MQIEVKMDICTLIHTIYVKGIQLKVIKQHICALVISLVGRFST